MTRWGEEEKKTKGLFGCFFALGLLAFAGYVTYLNVHNFENRRLLQEKVSNTISVNGFRSDEAKLKALVIQDAEDLGVFLDRDDVEITKIRDENNNRVVTLSLNYPLSFDLLFTKYDSSVLIYEEVTLIEF